MMGFDYFKYLTIKEKGFLLVSIGVILFLVYSVIFRGLSFGIDTLLVFVAALKSYTTLLSLGTHRIPVQKRSETTKRLLQQMEDQKWLFGGSLKSAVILWVVAVGWIVFAFFFLSQFVDLGKV